MYAVHPKGEFSLHIFSIASTWFIHHSVPKKIGLWKMEKELFVTPSQEWLFRAHSKKIPFHFPKRIGIIIIHSAERRGFYTENKSFEHDFFFKRLHDPELKINLFEKAAVKSSSDFNDQVFKNSQNPTRRVFASPFHRILKILDIHPTSFRIFLKWEKRGKFISHLKILVSNLKRIKEEISQNGMLIFTKKSSSI